MSFEPNPYRPPTTDSRVTDDSDRAAVRIRVEHLKRELTLRTIGDIYFIVGLILTVTGAIMLSQARDRIVPFESLAPYLAIGGIAFVVVSFGIRGLHSWGLWAIYLTSLPALLLFPVGTMAAGRLLTIALPASGRFLFSDEYRSVIARTAGFYPPRPIGWLILFVALSMLTIAFQWLLRPS